MKNTFKVPATIEFVIEANNATEAHDLIIGFLKEIRKTAFCGPGVLEFEATARFNDIKAVEP